MAVKKKTVRDAYIQAKKSNGSKKSDGARGGTLYKGSKGIQRARAESKSQNPSARNKIGVKPKSKNRPGPLDDIARFGKDFVKQGAKTAVGVKDVAYNLLGGKEAERIVRGKGTKSDYGWTALSVLPVGKVAGITGKAAAKGGGALAKGIASLTDDVVESAVKGGVKSISKKALKTSKKAVKVADKQTAKVIGKPALKAAKKESAAISKSVPKANQPRITPALAKQKKAAAAKKAKQAKRKAPMETTRPPKKTVEVKARQDKSRASMQRKEKQLEALRKSGKHIVNGETTAEYNRLLKEVRKSRKSVLSSAPKKAAKEGNPITNFRMKDVRRQKSLKRADESIEGAMMNPRTGEIRRPYEAVERKPSKKGGPQKEGKTELELDKANLKAGRDNQNDIAQGLQRGLTNEKKVIGGWNQGRKTLVQKVQKAQKRLKSQNLTPRQRSNALRASQQAKRELREYDSKFAAQVRKSYKTDTENLGGRYRSR